MRRREVLKQLSVELVTHALGRIRRGEPAAYLLRQAVKVQGAMERRGRRTGTFRSDGEGSAKGARR